MISNDYEKAQLEISVYKALSEYQKPRLYSFGEISLVSDGDDSGKAASYTLFYCVVELSGVDLDSWNTIVNHGLAISNPNYDIDKVC